MGTEEALSSERNIKAASQFPPKRHPSRNHVQFPREREAARFKDIWSRHLSRRRPTKPLPVQKHAGKRDRDELTPRRVFSPRRRTKGDAAESAGIRGDSMEDRSNAWQRFESSPACHDCSLTRMEQFSNHKVRFTKDFQ